MSQSTWVGVKAIDLLFIVPHKDILVCWTQSIEPKSIDSVTSVPHKDISLLAWFVAMLSFYYVIGEAKFVHCRQQALNSCIFIIMWAPNWELHKSNMEIISMDENPTMVGRAMRLYIGKAAEPLDPIGHILCHGRTWLDGSMGGNEVLFWSRRPTKAALHYPPNHWMANPNPTPLHYLLLRDQKTQIQWPHYHTTTTAFTLMPCSVD